MENYRVINTPTTNLFLPSSSFSFSHANNNLNHSHHSFDMNELVADLYPTATEEVILKISGAILHLINKSYSIELARGDLEILHLVQGETTVVAVFARVSDHIQWPLTKNEPAMKVDESRYLFLDSSNDKEEDMLIYGVTIDLKGQDPLLLEELDRILTVYSSFTVEEKATAEKNQCTAYWTSLAPNVEDYNGFAARLIAAISGHLIKGILWSGDVTMDLLMWGNEFMKQRLTRAEEEREVSSVTLKCLKRVKKMMKMAEKVANGVFSGITKYFGFFLSSMANNKVGYKLLSFLPGEMILATFVGFNKVFDAVEIAGINVMKTSSTITTEIVDHKYGAKTSQATNKWFGAVGHALGTIWSVFKIRQAFNPKGLGPYQEQNNF